VFPGDVVLFCYGVVVSIAKKWNATDIRGINPVQCERQQVPESGDPDGILKGGSENECDSRIQLFMVLLNSGVKIMVVLYIIIQRCFCAQPWRNMPDILKIVTLVPVSDGVVGFVEPGIDIIPPHPIQLPEILLLLTFEIPFSPILEGAENELMIPETVKQMALNHIVRVVHIAICFIPKFKAFVFIIPVGGIAQGSRISFIMFTHQEQVGFRGEDSMISHCYIIGTACIPVRGVISIIFATLSLGVRMRVEE